jgi:hypothetical protein
MNQRYDLSEYCSVIATIEKADGNESVGTMWTETKSFRTQARLEEVFDWANKQRASGRLTLTIDQSSKAVA